MKALPLYLCAVCDRPILDGWPHTDPNGEDVHDACCTDCHPELRAPGDDSPTTDDERFAASQRQGSRSTLDPAHVVGHGWPTQDQVAAAEAARWVPGTAS